MKMVSLTNLNQQIISNITQLKLLLVTAYFSSRNHDLFFIYIESIDIHITFILITKLKHNLVT